MGDGKDAPPRDCDCRFCRTDLVWSRLVAGGSTTRAPLPSLPLALMCTACFERPRRPPTQARLTMRIRYTGCVCLRGTPGASANGRRANACALPSEAVRY